MVIVAMFAVGAAFLGGALHQLRGVVRRWSDGDRSKNQAMVAAMSLIAVYGVLFLYSGVAALFGAQLSATTILTFFVVTVVVGVIFAVASLFSKRRAWSLDNDLRAASGRPDRRHWMPPLLVALIWLVGGSAVVIGLMLLVTGMVVGAGAPDRAADDFGPTAVTVLMGTAMVVATGAAGIQKWRLYREEKRLQVSDRAMTRHGHEGGQG
ncbi:MAG: hypothetical protein ACRDTD_15500 [Pseudonocardiaceae bacterium]